MGLKGLTEGILILEVSGGLVTRGASARRRCRRRRVVVDVDASEVDDLVGILVAARRRALHRLLAARRQLTVAREGAATRHSQRRPLVRRLHRDY